MFTPQELLPKKRCWPADDYFMRALPNAQDGNPVAIPVGGNIRDLTLAFQIQNFKEDANEAGGDRFNEHLNRHFGVSPRNETLQQPIYLGGGKSYISMPEVIQQSQTTSDSPLGERAGLGRSMVMTNPINYFTTEDTIVISILSIIPKATYSQGLDRMWRITTLTDFVLPQFNFLGDQAVLAQEILGNQPEASIKDVVGFVPKNEHLRFAKSYYCGEMRPEAPVNQSEWHLGRFFTPGIKVVINKDFVECNPPEERVFAVPSRDTVIYNAFHKLTASMPIPKHAQPGYSDHR